MKKHYLYLVRNKENILFKIGYTSQQNPRKRIRQYISHNPDIKVSGYWEVPNKNFDIYVQNELKKLWYKSCLVKGQKEWFEGIIENKELEEIIERFKKRNL